MRVVSIRTYPVKGCHRVDRHEVRVEPWGLAGDRRWMLVDADGVGVTQRETSRLVALRPDTVDGGLTLRADGRPDLPVPEPVDGPVLAVRVFRSKAPVPARVADDSAARWLSGLTGRPVRLVWLGDPTVRPVDPAHADPGERVSFADGYPVLLANTASLGQLNAWLAEREDAEGPLPVDRFRPNVVIAGATAWAEDDWVGRRLRIGPVVFRAAKPSDRCVVTTIDQEHGGKGREPLRTLAVHRRVGRDLLFGLNLIPDRPAPTDRISVGDRVELLPEP